MDKKLKWFEVADEIPNLTSFMAFEVQDLFNAYRLERAKNRRSEIIISQLIECIAKKELGQLEPNVDDLGGSGI